MSDNSYTFNTPKGDTRKEYPYKNRRASLKFWLLKIVLIVILFALILEIAYYFIVLPLISSVKFIFNIEGQSITESEAMAMMNLTGKEKWGSLDSSKMAFLLKAQPVVEHAEVRKKFPDKVLVDIIERHPVAVSFANIGGSSVPLEIDKEGVIFRIGWNANTPFLTIVSGIDFQNPKLGMKMSYKLTSLFNNIDFIAREEPLLLSSVSEIKIQEKKYGDYELILYPSHKNIKVLASKEFSAKTLNRMVLVLDVINNNEEFMEDRLECIDIRGVNVVYKWKETKDK